MKIFKILLWPNTFCDSHYPNLPWVLGPMNPCEVCGCAKYGPANYPPGAEAVPPSEGRNALLAHSNVTQGCSQTTWAEQSRCSGGQVVFTLASVRSLLTAGLDSGGVAFQEDSHHSTFPYRALQLTGLTIAAHSWHQCRTPRWGFDLLPHGQRPSLTTEGQRTGPLYLPRSILILSVYHLHLHVFVVMFTNRQVIGPWCASMNR